MTEPNATLRRVFCRSCGAHVYDLDWPGHYPRAMAEDLRDVGYGLPERGGLAACPACGFHYPLSIKRTFRIEGVRLLPEDDTSRD